MPQLCCKVLGRVQGVFFRATACEEAERLSLAGWVRNCADGSVECVAEGPREKLEQFLKWLHHGPPAARVTRVDTDWLEADGDFRRFEVR